MVGPALRTSHSLGCVYFEGVGFSIGPCGEIRSSLDQKLPGPFFFSIEMHMNSIHRNFKWLKNENS